MWSWSSPHSPVIFYTWKKRNTFPQVQRQTAENFHTCKSAKLTWLHKCKFGMGDSWNSLTGSSLCSRKLWQASVPTGKASTDECTAQCHLQQGEAESLSSKMWMMPLWGWSRQSFGIQNGWSMRSWHPWLADGIWRGVKCMVSTHSVSLAEYGVWGSVTWQCGYT